MRNPRPLSQLVLSRVREFFREPEAIFWVYGFPILLMVGLGIAFREGGAEPVRVGVAASAEAEDLARQLRDAGGFQVEVEPEGAARDRYRRGRTDVVVVAASDGGVHYVFDPTRKEGEAARSKVDAALQRARGRRDAFVAADEVVTEPGSRYIDWLIPGLLGMGLMGGGMWGLGYVTVEFRMKKLLKRLVATPMRRSHFLLSLLISRLLFLVPETLILLAAAMLFFGFQVLGSIAAVVVAVLAGSLCFAGIGLLVACRTAKMEVISGLMNLVMLPMWLMSGIFFSAERFPDPMQPFVQALPLTQLNNLLRAIMLEGASLASQAVPLLVLAGWAVLSFSLALRWFRWI